VKRFQHILRLDETGSTNDEMMAILGEERSRGLTIVAKFQRKGAGRKGRSWVAPPGSGLLFTTALPDPVPSKNLWIVPFWIALVVRNALERWGIVTTLQWPNDLLLGDRKCGGILCISRVNGERAWVACGVGLNVQRPSDATALAGITPPPAFLSDVRSRVVLRQAQDDTGAQDDTAAGGELLDTILEEMEKRCEQLDNPGAIAREWDKAAGIPGARYRLLIDGSGETFEGAAFGLDDGGALKVDADGDVRTIAAADARVLRQAQDDIVGT